MKDLMGQAIWDFYFQNDAEDMETETSISEIDEFPTEYLFRNYSEMNDIEKKALQLSYGHVLDIGAGAGCHSLYLQNEKNIPVTALDISKKSIEVCKKQGLQNSICMDILDFSAEKFDTILMLMNGTGIFKSLSKIDIYLQKLKSLLNEKGQILIDSTDIIYMFDKDKDGGVYIPANGYYGELDYIIYYKGDMEITKWLYMDYQTLKNAVESNGLKIELIAKEDYSFLAKIIFTPQPRLPLKKPDSKSSDLSLKLITKDPSCSAEKSLITPSSPIKTKLVSSQNAPVGNSTIT